MEHEYRNSPDCPVKDILYLIKQEDTESIRQALLEVINKSYPDSEIYLYKQGYSLYESKGKEFTPVYVTEEMVGHKLGEFSPTRKFVRHGGRMQKEVEQASKQQELDASKAAKESSEATK